MIHLNNKQSNNKTAAPIKKPGISIPKKLEILEYLLSPEDISIQASINNNESLVNNNETLINNHSSDLNLSSQLVNELSGEHSKYMDQHEDICEDMCEAEVFSNEEMSCDKEGKKVILKRSCLDLKTKIYIAEEITREKSSYTELAFKFKTNKSVVGRIGDNIEKYLSTDVNNNVNKRIKGIKDPSDLYFNVIDNVKKLRNSSITVTKRMIGEFAKKEAIRLKISKFKFSNNWFRNFKNFFFFFKEQN